MLMVLITNYETLEWPRQLVDVLLATDGVSPVIVDNASTYEPLLRWYESGPCQVIRLKENLRGKAVWIAEETKALIAGQHEYVVTDCDLDISNVPKDWPDVLRRGMDKFPWARKCGLSIETDDLPPGVVYPKSEVLHWESPRWTSPLDGGYFDSLIDTTLALYVAERHPFGTNNGSFSIGKSLMVDRPYTCRHLPYYVRSLDSTGDDYVYYMRKCMSDPVFSHGLAAIQGRALGLSPL